MVVRLVREIFSFKSVITIRSLLLLCLLSLIFISYRNIITNDSNNSTLTDRSNGQRKNRDTCFISEKNRDIRSTYYRHATDERNTSYPLISGDTYRAFANFVFDETRQDDLRGVRFGDSVFVKADMFDQFFGQPYQSIEHPFVLITHNSDFYAPRDFKNKLEDKKILVWYASNPDIPKHPKLVPIPIGLANTRWPFGNLTRLLYAYHRHRKPWANRTTLLYANFNLGSNPGQRQIARAQAEKLRNAQVVKKTISFDGYLEELGNTKFVLSPPGNGLDCHRTWEALLLGAVPIVLSSGLDPLFDHIPAIIIDDWPKLTDDLLLSYSFPQANYSTPAVMCGRYWFERIIKHRNQSS